jgi:Glycine-zipper domain
MTCSTVRAVCLLLFLSVASACKKSDSGAPAAAPTPAGAPTGAPAAGPAAAPTPTGAPAAAPAAGSAAAPVPAGPPPPFSAAQKLGMFAFAKNNQSQDQQLRDEYDCYGMVQQQTGINPEAPPPAGASAADVQAAQDQAAANAPQAKGGRARGAAKGAVGGAVIGGIAGDAGTGAAVGATVGTVRGGRQQRKANEASKDQAAQAAGAQVQQQSNQAQAAYNQQMNTFKQGFSACMDARGYSVK